MKTNDNMLNDPGFKPSYLDFVEKMNTYLNEQIQPGILNAILFTIEDFYYGTYIVENIGKYIKDKDGFGYRVGYGIFNITVQSLNECGKIGNDITIKGNNYYSMLIVNEILKIILIAKD